MSAARLVVWPGVYRDSLLLLSATRAMRDGDDVAFIRRQRSFHVDEARGAIGGDVQPAIFNY